MFQRQVSISRSGAALSMYVDDPHFIHANIIITFHQMLYCHLQIFIFVHQIRRTYLHLTYANHESNSCNNKKNELCHQQFPCTELIYFD